MVEAALEVMMSLKRLRRMMSWKNSKTTLTRGTMFTLLRAAVSPLQSRSLFSL